MSGFKLSLAGAKNKPGFKQAGTATPPVKRPRLALGDDEPEDTTKSMEISGFDTASGGALDISGRGKEIEAPRVIPSLPNRNWRDEVLRKQAVNTEQSGQNAKEHKGSNVAYGLTIIKKAEGQSEQNSTADTKQNSTADTDPTPMEIENVLTEEQKFEKRALDALLNGKSSDDRIIPTQTEEEAFQQHVQEAPDAPSLDAYLATPIEGFGAALLRGMGWKDGEEIGRNKGVTAKPHEMKRRPALLGIGAKEEAAVGIELGEWGGSGKGKKKVDKTYNPVVMRNKITGEQISEEELKIKIEQQNMMPEDGKDRKDREREKSYDSEAEERRRRKRKERERRERDRSYDSNDYSRKRDRKDRDRRDKNDKSEDDDRRRSRRDGSEDNYDRKHSKPEKSYDKSDRRRDRSRDDYHRKRDKRHDRSGTSNDSDRRSQKRDYGDDRYDHRSRRDRSRSRDSVDSRKRRRDYDDERDDRKRRYKDDRR